MGEQLHSRFKDEPASDINTANDLFTPVERRAVTLAERKVSEDSTIMARSFVRWSGYSRGSSAERRKGQVKEHDGVWFSDVS